MKRLAAAALLALSLPATARADDPPHQAVDAQALYDQAMMVLAQRRYEAACPMFEDIVKLLPDSNAARAAAAECHLRAGRLATALARYTSIEADAAAKGEMKRAAQARARIESLRPRVVNLLIEVPPQIKALPGLAIRLDGAELAPSQLNAPTLLDRGLHKIEVTATGHDPMVTTVDSAEENETLVVPVDMPRRQYRPPPRAERPATAPPLASGSRGGLAPPNPQGSPVPGIAVLGAGVGALGIGTVTGVLTLMTASSLKRACAGDLCPPSQLGTGQQAAVLATASTVELVVGAAVAAAGVALLVVRPWGRGNAEASITAGPGSLRVVGTF